MHDVQRSANLPRPPQTGEEIVPENFRATAFESVGAAARVSLRTARSVGDATVVPPSRRCRARAMDLEMQKAEKEKPAPSGGLPGCASERYIVLQTTY
jgi:hypothetical protein